MPYGNLSTVESILLEEGQVVYKIKGRSMEPMLIPNKDIVTIRKKGNGESFVENDIILYKANGKLILHRVIQTLPTGKYVTLGDNSSKKEYDIEGKQIIGVLQAFTHNGIHYDVDDPQYLDYVERLRKCEKQRIRFKYLYDLVTWIFKHLPQYLLDNIKKKFHFRMREIISFEK